MKYQFECEEIKECYKCPFVWESYCTLLYEDICFGKIRTDCPLVNVEKNEELERKYD